LGARMLTIALNLGDEPVTAELPPDDPLAIIGGAPTVAAIAPASFAAWLA
jgi:hypothetical protein